MHEDRESANGFQFLLNAFVNRVDRRIPVRIERFVPFKIRSSEPSNPIRARNRMVGTLGANQVRTYL